MQQRLVGNLKRFVERFSFIGINAALAAFDLCQRAARQVTACKLRFRGKLFLRQTSCEPRSPDRCADSLAVFQIRTSTTFARCMLKIRLSADFLYLRIILQAAT